MNAEYFLLGITVSLSLILAIGAQNVFVIEQGLKRNYIFLVCLICATADFLLIFLGIFIFHLFADLINKEVELTLNIILLLYLLHFIFGKAKELKKSASIHFKNEKLSLSVVVEKTLIFTFLNAHVYSDTVFFLGNFAKNFNLMQKISFGIGASLISFVFFFVLGYLSKALSLFAQSQKIWMIINISIILIMSALSLFVLFNIIGYF